MTRPRPFDWARLNPQIKRAIEYRTGPSASVERSVRIVSNDLTFTQQREAEITASRCGWRVATLGWREFGERWLRLPDEAAVLDLRGGEAWESFSGAITANGFGGPALIGLVGAGFPVEFAAIGDLMLAVAVTDEVCPVDWNSTLLQACFNHQARYGQPVAPRQSLAGTRHQLLSYTPELSTLIEELTVVARHNYNLLITGETGSGKTTLARLVHDLSPRAGKRFLTVSCGALPSDLMGSELFGHVRGAFTGADHDKEGKFEYADGGTLVLEEIDTLDLVQQAKLLRVLEWGEFERVGSNETRRVDVRVIVTANIHLERLVETGRFRSDLYYRLRQLTFDLPPLRERPRDVAWLVKTLVEECCRTNELSIDRIDPRVFGLLRSVRLPGNIRDLRNEIHRAVLFCKTGVLTPSCLSRPLRAEADEQRDVDDAALEQAAARNGAKKTSAGLAEEVASAEIATIERALRDSHFNRTAAARLLGISRVTLYNKLRKYGIRLEDDRKPS